MRYNNEVQQSRLATEKADILTALTAHKMSISTGVSAMAIFSYLQYHAHAMVTLAIRTGDLLPLQFCEDCGETSNRQLDSHHEDYSKPLEVIWLCHSCHSIRHKTNPDVIRSRRAPKLTKALEWFEAHPGNLETPSRELVESIGVSHITIFNAQRILLSQRSQNVDNEVQ